MNLSALKNKTDTFYRGKIFPHFDLKYQELECVTTDLGRHYVSPNGNKLTSVTTMLGRTGDKTWLEAWRDRLGVEAADAETQRCADRGEGVHLSCEYYLRNYDMEKVISASGKYVNLFHQLRPFLDKIDKVYALEIPLYSEKIRLAGRVDCIAFYEGIPCIIDFKTSNSLKTRGMIEDYSIQLALYSIMFESMFGVRIEKLVNMISTEGRTKPTIIEFFRSDVEKKALKRTKEYHLENIRRNGVWTD